MLGELHKFQEVINSEHLEEILDAFNSFLISRPDISNDQCVVAVLHKFTHVKCIWCFSHYRGDDHITVGMMRTLLLLA